MKKWVVYSKDGLVERCELKAVEYSGSFMGERAVTATFESYEEVDFEVFDYIEYRGEKFELDAAPTVKKISKHEYSYELRFVSLKYELERCEMRDIVPNDNGVVYPTPLSFSFTGDVTRLAERIQACLDAMYGKKVWTIAVADGVESEEQHITIAQQNCWNALALVNTTYKLNFYIKERTVTIGGTQPVSTHTFKYGKGNGLYEIERVADAGTGIVTRLRAFGSNRNLDYSYPKRPEWTDSVLDTSFAFSPLRLMLPSFKKDGKTDYLMASNEAVAKYGIREASIVYDDIYPTITGATNGKGERIDRIKAVDAVDDSAQTFVVHLYDLGFDLEEHLTNDTAQISMKTGAMQGYTFDMQSIEKEYEVLGRSVSDREENLPDGEAPEEEKGEFIGYKITLNRLTLSEGETDDFRAPNSNWTMKAGDEFVLLGILMPQAYIREAEVRLEERAREYLEQYSKTNFGYNIGIHDKFLIENEGVYGELIEGSKLHIEDEELGISEDVTIQSLTITEDMGSNLLPQVKVTLNNEPNASTLERIQGQINDIANSVGGSGSTQSEILKQYRKKLDRPFFDRLFAAVDKNGKEIAATDLVTPIAYIKSRYDFAVIGGVTSYIKDDWTDLPSIYDGLPIDNQTLKWKEYVADDGSKVRALVAEGGGEGKLKGIEVTGTGNAITSVELEDDGTMLMFRKDKEFLDKESLEGEFYNKEYIDENFALVSDVNGLAERFDDFLEGSDTDTIINKWKELETFLSGLTESDNLSEILLGKADKSYLDENFYTKTDADTRFIGIKGDYNVEGKKNFIGGLFVNGKEIAYHTEGGYWELEGDLLVTGGIASFSSSTAYKPSTVMDGVVTDNQTIKVNEHGQLEVIQKATDGVKVKIVSAGDAMNEQNVLYVIV